MKAFWTKIFGIITKINKEGAVFVFLLYPYRLNLR